MFTRLVQQEREVLSITNQMVANYPEIKETTAVVLKNREYIDFPQAGQIEDSCRKFGVPEVSILTGWAEWVSPSQCGGQPWSKGAPTWTWGCCRRPEFHLEVAVVQRKDLQRGNLSHRQAGLRAQRQS